MMMTMLLLMMIMMIVWLYGESPVLHSVSDCGMISAVFTGSACVAAQQYP